MNLGVDIDGVLTILDFIKPSKDKDESILDSSPSIKFKNKKLLRTLWYHGIRLYSEKARIRPNASLVLNTLKNEGVKIFIISKREFAFEDSKYGSAIRILVQLYLMEHDIPYDEIIFVSDNKVRACLDNKIDVMIEDNPGNAKVISKYIPVILLNTPYNSKIKGNNIIRAYNWIDIYNKIPRKGKVLTHEKNKIIR